MHQVLHLEEQAPADAAARVEERQVVHREVPLLHQGHGQRVTQGEGRSGARRGDEVVGTGLFHPHVEHDVPVAGDSGCPVARHHDGRHAHPLYPRQDLDYLFGLSAVGDNEEDVLLLHYAQVAVERIRRVEIYRRHADAREGGGDLLGYRGPTCPCRRRRPCPCTRMMASTARSKSRRASPSPGGSPRASFSQDLSAYVDKPAHRASPILLSDFSMSGEIVEADGVLPVAPGLFGVLVDLHEYAVSPDRDGRPRQGEDELPLARRTLRPPRRVSARCGSRRRSPG